MNAQQRRALLGSLTGHLLADSPKQEKAIQDLYASLSRSHLPDNTALLKASSFNFEGSDLFSEGTIAPSRLTALQSLADRFSEAEAEFRVFVREVPVRSSQLQTSSPSWAHGVAVDHTIGPLTNSDGRLFWFDFFRIERLVALYVQGNPYPALLFKIRTGIIFGGANLPLSAEILPTYKLDAGSIWINSQLLALNSPGGFFTGLTIKSGTITLSAKPQLINGKLTISPTTRVSVNLQLAQQPVVGADPTSPYGKDARDMQLDLPKVLEFHFTGQNSSFDHVGDASWRVFGHVASFTWNRQQAGTYDTLVNRVLIPFTASTQSFRVNANASPFHTLAGETPIAGSFWALPAASIDVANPSPAAGIGAMLVIGGTGLTAEWQGLNGGALNLNKPYIMAEPGRIAVSDLTSGNVFSQQDFNLWKDAQNPFGTTAHIQYLALAPYFFNTLASGIELISTLVNADVRADRPVTVKGEALAIRSKNSLLILAVSSAFRLIYLYDDNILIDNLGFGNNIHFPEPISLALHNALFKVTPVNGCLLFGLLAEDFVKVERGFLFLTFGMFAYLPTLPDPYAANINRLKYQFRGSRDQALVGAAFGNQSIWLWLVCEVQWRPGVNDNDTVQVSFHFAPLQSQLLQAIAAGPQASSGNISFEPSGDAGVAAAAFSTGIGDVRLPDYGAIWDESTGLLQNDLFALLDVSTNADLLGISFSVFNDQRYAMVATLAPVGSTSFPLRVQGMDVVSNGVNVRAFTVPQISWEPVFNLTPKAIAGDPDAGFNYYPNDGGPTRIINNDSQQVALAPIPLTDFLVANFAERENFAALSLFTLPFGMKALALLQKHYRYQNNPRRGSNFLLNAKSFPNDVTGARQFEVDGGQALREGENDMFMGSTVQINNILNLFGAPTGNSTLGASVTKIFNNEWLLDPFQLIRQRGVPLSRMDLSGYGASIFSDWLNPHAAIAETSQAQFDVFVGRCAHEIIQVRSILYPWAIKVVRTITLFRTSSNYVYRYDSGWRAESEGCFDFTYYVYVDDPMHPGQLKPEERQGKYEIHPGIVGCLVNIQNIKETQDVTPITGTMFVGPNEFYVDENGKEQKNTTGSDMPFNFELQPVFFDADLEIENPVSGFAVKDVDGTQEKLVPSTHILGFVQIAPRGMPLTTQAFADMISRQGGTIGAAINTVVDIGLSGQQMRVNSFDVSNSFAANGTDLIFAVAGRGNVLLPKDGSWSMVKHQFGTGEVNPVPQELSVPLIRIGKLIKQAGKLVLDKDPLTQLLRIANPTELLRSAVNDTINYGFLQSTDTQKALFLTPSFKHGLDKLLSKTPPIFADAFRIVSSKAIFPNIGDAASGFGDAISLLKNGTEFVQNAMTDGGKQVLEVMQINQTIAAVKQEGYKLLKQIESFDLPTTSWTLIELGSAFKIYLEYKADNIQKPANDGGGTKDLTGALNFDVDSFAGNLEDQWKSKMANIGIVVDLGPIKRLMTIKGDWNANKGSEAQYGGNPGDPDFPSPQIEFAPELQPIIEILEILEDLQGENYKDAFQHGLKLAMSNKAGSWEYKLEASKEIPVVRFPMPMFVYNDPNTPLKLEAGLKLSAYFNAALMVTTDPKQLLPTAGASVGFYGRLSVMCVSLSVATVYAIGQVNLDIGCDTKVGPSLKMKFGFGAQIVVGLPVVGNVSVLYMVGVEIYTDSTTLIISGFLLFQGHAELLAGLVSVTITIEAKGTISRSSERTDLTAQVTFGLDISIFLVINISFSTSWSESRQIA